MNHQITQPVAPTIRRSQRPSNGPPPPYTTPNRNEEVSEVHSPRQDTIVCTLLTLSREKTLPCVTTATKLPDIDPSSLKIETGRVRSFLMFILGADYCCNSGVILTQEDRAFFIAIGRWFVGLYRANQKGKLSQEDIMNTHHYIRDWVFCPTAELRIPIDIFVVAIIRFVRSMELYGEYRSSVMDVLREDGVDRLAEKAYFDKRDVITCLVSDPALRKGLQRQVDNVVGQYIGLGIQPRYSSYHCDTSLGLQKGPRVTFTLTDLGREYEARRKRESRWVFWLGWLWRLCGRKQS